MGYSWAEGPPFCAVDTTGQAGLARFPSYSGSCVRNLASLHHRRTEEPDIQTRRPNWGAECCEKSVDRLPINVNAAAAILTLAIRSAIAINRSKIGASGRKQRCAVVPKCHCQLGERAW